VTCDRCGTGLSGKQQRWCSKRCSDAAHSAVRRAIISQRGRAGSRGRVGVEQITDVTIAEVKALYPSCARDWDVAMVEKAWPRLTTLFPRRLERLN
jgi:hypothetical protein